MTRIPPTRAGGSKSEPPMRKTSISANSSGRGSSTQGAGQDAKGGPSGASQGGASRGSSRLEPSHQKRASRQARAKK